MIKYYVKGNCITKNISVHLFTNPVRGIVENQKVSPGFEHQISSLIIFLIS